MNTQTEKSNIFTPGIFAILLIIILIFAGWVRTYNIDWDHGTHLHPDERYLTMVVSAIRFPDNLNQYWDTENSPLNPTNHNQFANYVYGTLPLFTTRAVGMWVDAACGDAPSIYGTMLRALLLGSTQSCEPGQYTGYGGIHLVGRTLSAFFDLLTLVALALFARRLYDNRVALLAAALYAFAVLPIQHAHFFVVDSFATVFVVWTLYFSIQAVQSRKPLWLLPAGLTTGLAVASKISVWPLAGVVALATFLRQEDTEEHGLAKYSFGFSVIPFIIAVFSGGLAALAFRAGQPYAFTGPGFWGIQLNPRWMNTMRDIRDLMAGLRDVPFGHQWTNRTPIIFPGRNMIFWGLGLPLGLCAWVGWVMMGWDIVRKRKWHHLLIWAWGTAFFLYQGTQWVKSMRYLLPVYPVFALFAAWIVLRVYDARKIEKPAAASPWQQIAKVLATSLPILLLVGTMVWAWAFLRIYAQPVTRIQASHWMFANIPTAITFETQQGLDLQIPLKPSTLLDNMQPIVTQFTPTQNRDVARIVVNKISGIDRDGMRKIHIKLSTDRPGAHVLAQETITIEVPAQGTASASFEFSSSITLERDVPIYIWLSMQEGATVKLQSSVIANEHWDDPLPLRIGGKDPFWNWYQSLSSSVSSQMNNYDSDTPQKREQLLNWLDEADYIALSSNRLYGSIARLPMRYPLTVAYYEALFDGSLGFELAAEFVSYPALGPCQFPDQEIPFALIEPRYTNGRRCEIPFPPAEEAFSVYDHPTVLIFAKTEEYSRARTEVLLPATLLDNVFWMTPKEATQNKQRQISLLMDDEAQQIQQKGGTWSQIFDRTAPQNRFQILAAFLWWLMFLVLGIIAFPWLYLAFPALRYRGYGLTKITGLLLWTYIVWICASLRIFPNTRLWLWCALVGWGALSAVVIRAHWSEMSAFLKENWRALLRVEIIFIILYAIWVYVRYLNPDLWHPVMGGEKPMDFAYLNAIIKSTWFPPYDPWFSGGVMNYYYFGLMMFAVLIKTLGIIPSIAYNLAVPSLFAMTGVGAYTLASNLLKRRGDADDDKRAHRVGLWGLLLLLILGNLGELRLLFKGFEEVGNVHFESLIPGYQPLVSALAGFWKVIIQKKSLMFRPEWWYWNARSIIPIAPGEAGPINEFPAFTFLYGDLHAHMIAIPLTQVALAIALQWAIGWGKHRRREAGAPASFFSALVDDVRHWDFGIIVTFALAALVAGSLRATNTWDYPTYLALMSVGYIINLFSTRAAQQKFPYHKLLLPVCLLLVAEILYLPFTRNYAVAYTSFGFWKGTRTPLGIYFLMHGQFVFPLAIMAIQQCYDVVRQFLSREDKAALLPLGALGVGMLALLLTLHFLGVPAAWIVIPLGVMATLLVLAPESAPRERLMWFWVGTALTLTLAVEIIVLKGDIGRMNTVFKFYLQVWMLLALSAAVAVTRIVERVMQAPVPSIETTKPKLLSSALNDVIFGILVVLLLSTALYPVLAIPAKAQDRWRPEAPRTLDGTAFMPYAVQYEHGGEIPIEVDYRVIRWFQDNVEGSPVIIEAQAEREYLWGNRVSVHTGLPSVVAWRWHQVQQRMTMPGYTVEKRQNLIRDFYNTSSPEFAMEILELYDVTYVVFTPYERAYMLPEGEAKFSAMVARGWLNVVYEEPEAKIYEVVN